MTLDKYMAVPIIKIVSVWYCSLRISCYFSYEFSPWAVEDMAKSVHVLYMMKDIFCMATK